MNKQQIKTSLDAIRGYDLAFKATKQLGYKLTRDKYLRALKQQIRAKQGYYLKAVV